MDDCTDLDEFVLGLDSSDEIWFGRVLGLG